MRVTQHNLKRQLHENTNDVAYDLDIACQAKTWADHMANNDSFAHAPADQRPGQGENLAMTWSTGTLPTGKPNRLYAATILNDGKSRAG